MNTSVENSREIIRHAFENLGFETLWCGYFDGNEKSRHAQGKCGFTYHHTNKDVYLTLTNDIRTAHERRMGKGINDESKTLSQRKNKGIQCHLR